MSRPNKYFYRNRVRKMPRLRNDPPYGKNAICAWFSGLYGCTLARGQKHFDRARSLSRHSRSPFLLFDRQTGEWHGSGTP